MKIYLLSFCLLLISCGAQNDKPMSQYIKQVKQRTRSTIIEMPDFSTIPTLTHSYDNAYRSPFRPSSLEDAKRIIKKATLSQDVLRYPLDAYKLVGLLKQEKHLVALVQTPIGVLFFLKEGDLIGIHSGRVTDIQDEYIVIKEVNQKAPDDLPKERRIYMQRSHDKPLLIEKNHV